MEFNIRKLLSRVRRAVDDYGMISPGDRIAVGVSGGKDSLALLCSLVALRRFYPIPFEVTAVTLDMGFSDLVGKVDFADEAAFSDKIEKSDLSSLAAFYEKLGVEYRIERTNLADIIFHIRKEPNPCALCAKMRRGMLHDISKEMGCNKIALGHHYDDVLETFMMNLCNEGRLGTFSPVTYLDRKDITVIRPFVLTKESEIAAFVSANSIPVIPSACPEDKHTDREWYKGLLDELSKEKEGLRHRIFGAIVKADLSGYGVKNPHVPRRKKRETWLPASDPTGEGKDLI